jgi:hypothetical protein
MKIENAEKLVVMVAGPKNGKIARSVFAFKDTRLPFQHTRLHFYFYSSQPWLAPSDGTN